MSIDYDRLQKILERATPGPWTVEDDGYDIIVGDEEGHSLGWGDQVRFKFEAGDQTHDPALVALAPDLARELLRLRDGVEQLREMCLLVRDASLHENPASEGAANAFDTCAKQLTELLEGDRDI